MNDYFQTVIQNRHSIETSHSRRERMVSTPHVLRVALIDSHQFPRECFISAAFSLQPLIAFTPFSSADDFATAALQPVDLVTYVHHGPVAAGLDDLSTILRVVPMSRIVVISGLSSDPNNALAQEFELRSAAVIKAQYTSLQKTVSTLFVVYYGHCDMAEPSQSPWAAERDRLHVIQPFFARNEPLDLTRRERMVLEHVRKGQPNKEIAQDLMMSISTVKAHVRNIMQKTGATNRIQLALNADRLAGPNG